MVTRFRHTKNIYNTKKSKVKKNKIRKNPLKKINNISSNKINSDVESNTQHLEEIEESVYTKNYQKLFNRNISKKTLRTNNKLMMYSDRENFNKLSRFLIAVIFDYLHSKEIIEFSHTQKKILNIFKDLSRVEKDFPSVYESNLNRFHFLNKNNNLILIELENMTCPDNYSKCEKIQLFYLLLKEFYNEEKDFQLYNYLGFEFTNKYLYEKYLSSDDCEIFKFRFELDYITRIRDRNKKLFTEKTYNSLTKLIKKNRNVRNFYFGSFDFSITDLTLLFESIEKDKVIDEIRFGVSGKNITNCIHYNNNIIRFFEAIEKNENIKKFNLYIGKPFIHTFTPSFTNMLKNNRSIIHLNLRKENLSDFSFLSLNPCLEVFETGGYINLLNLVNSLDKHNQNNISNLSTIIFRGFPNDSCKFTQKDFLKRLLYSNNTIKHMKFINVFWDDEIFVYLGEGLHKNNTLQTIQYQNKKFRKMFEYPGFQEILESLNVNKCLNEIKINLEVDDSNKFTTKERNEQGYDEVKTYRKKPKTLLQFNRIFH